MFLLPAVIIGVLAGFALGGRIDRLADVRLRAPWVFFLALGLQLVAFTSLFDSHVPESVATAMSIGSYACLLAVFVLNARLPGMPIAGAGMLLNLAAILANGGHMPALPRAMRAAGTAADAVAELRRRCWTQFDARVVSALEKHLQSICEEIPEQVSATA